MTQLQTIIDQVTGIVGDIDTQLETETANLSDLQNQLSILVIRDDSRVNMTADLATQADLKKQIADSENYLGILQERRESFASDATKQLDLKNAVRAGVSADLKAGLAASEVAAKMATAQQAMADASAALGDWLTSLDAVNSEIKANGKQIDKLVAAGGQVFANQFVTSWVQTGFIATAKTAIDRAGKDVASAYGNITA